MVDTSIRIGIISSVNYEKGMLSVVYPDRDNSVTGDLPYINMNGEYKMPNVDDMVLVLHLSNGTAMGIVIGTVWNNNNVPFESGEGLFRKELGMVPNEAYIRYDSKTKVCSIKANTVQFETETGITTL